MPILKVSFYSLTVACGDVSEHRRRSLVRGVVQGVVMYHADM